jgi:hypothetical protein
MKRFLPVFLLFCLGCLYFFALISSDHHSSNRTAESTTRSSYPQTQPVIAPADHAKAVKCKGLLKDSARLGLWRHYDQTGDGLTVDVGPAFYSSDFETKGILNQLLRCVATDGSMDQTAVAVIIYRDWRTHKDVANWTPVMSLQVEDH